MVKRENVLSPEPRVMRKTLDRERHVGSKGGQVDGFSGAPLGHPLKPTTGVMAHPCRPISIASTAGLADWAVPDGSWCLISAVDTHWQGPAGSGPMAVAALTAGEMSLQGDGLGPRQVCLLALEKVGIKTLVHQASGKRVCRLGLGLAILAHLLHLPPLLCSISTVESQGEGGKSDCRAQFRPIDGVDARQLTDNSRTTHGQLTVAFWAPLGLSYHVAFSFAWQDASFPVKKQDKNLDSGVERGSHFF